MLFIAIGVVLIVLNLLGVGPMGRWNWELFGDIWKFALPFLFAMAWWVWSDLSGLNKKREIERMEKRKADRRKENLVSLGLDSRAHRKARKG